MSGARVRKETTIRRHLVVAGIATSALLALSSVAARADGILPPLPIGKGSPTPSPSPSSSAKPSASPTPSASPSPTASPTQATPPPQGPAPTPFNGPLSAIDFVLNTMGTARNTQHLLDLLMLLQPPGVPLDTPAVARGFGRFPVAGYVWYQDDYGAPRFEPYLHLHEGVDLFAPPGTPVTACVAGVIAKVMDGTIGGRSIWLAGDDGITYYYGHLSTYAPGIAEGMRVSLGQVIASVGNTGVAQDTYPHLHFEVHPGGGAPVSPKPILDAWLTEAEANADAAYQRLLEYNALNRIGGARWQRIFDLMREPAAPQLSFWEAALSPTATAFGLDLALEDLAWRYDPATLSAASGSNDRFTSLGSGLFTARSGGGSLASGLGSAR